MGTDMAGGDSGDVTDDAAARQAAEVAVELSEGSGPADKRIGARLHEAADRTTTAAAFVAAGARRGGAAGGGHGGAPERGDRPQGGGQGTPWRQLGRPRRRLGHELADRAGGRDGTAA